MNTTIIHSDPPRGDTRRAGSTLRGEIVGNKIESVELLAGLLNLLAEGLEDLVASLAEEGVEDFEPVSQGDFGSASLHFMLHPEGKDIILDIEVISWIYELPQREFHKYLFEKMKPAFAKIFEKYAFSMPDSSEFESWYRMMCLGAILLNNTRG